MKKAVFLCNFILFTVAAHAQYYQWAQRAGSPSYDAGYDLKTDRQGNVYVTGKFLGTALFGDSTVTSSGETDIFLAKYNQEGDVVWVRHAGGPGSDSGSGIAMDSSGNIYLTGYFNNSAIFSGTQLTTRGGADIFIAKYAPGGTLHWVMQAGGEEDDEGEKIVADREGNTYVSGNFKKQALFSPVTVAGKGAKDGFVARYSPEGKALWVRNFGSSADIAAHSVAADKAGNIMAAGFFEDTLLAENNVIMSKGSRDAFLVKYSPEGMLEWVETSGGTDFDEGKSVCADADGNIYLTGCFSGDINFDSLTLSAFGGKDIFISKYSRDGKLLWVNRAGSPGTDKGLAITADSIGNVYTAGYFENDLIFHNKKLQSKGDRDIFIAKHDPAGAVEWVQQAGGIINDYAEAICTDNAGTVHLTGSYQGTVMFDKNIFVTNNGNVDVMVAQLSPNINSRANTLKQGGFACYPNTKKGTITLEFKEDAADERYQVYLIGSDGLAVYEDRIKPDADNRSYTINLAMLANDSYLLNVSSKTSNYFQKITIKRRKKIR